MRRDPRPRLRRALVAAVTAAVVTIAAGLPAAAEDPVRTLPGSLGPAPTDAYVQRVHRLFLGRSATTAQLRELSHLVHRSGTTALTSRLALSPEWAGVRIDELYQTILGRAPDPAGRANWLDQLARGRTLEEVAAGFYGSVEYFRQVGARNDAYVDSLYRRLLGREPDGPGRRHWLDRLRAGAGRVTIAASFYASLESRRQRVDGLYREVLGRAPDPAGRTHWVERLPAIGNIGLASHLAASDEMHRRATGGVPFPVVRAEAVGPGTRFPLASSWRPGCPVGPSQLRAVTFPHFRPDGTRTTGVLVVHRDVVVQVSTLVRAAHGTRFPLTQVRPVDDFGGSDDASMAADNSSAFNCRTVAGTTTWSQHAYGRAIDLNPVANPYVRAGRVDPPAGAEFQDRSDVRPGMLVEGGGVIEAVDRLGWGWGGRWTSGADHQHLSRSGR